MQTWYKSFMCFQTGWTGWIHNDMSHTHVCPIYRLNCCCCMVHVTFYFGNNTLRHQRHPYISKCSKQLTEENIRSGKMEKDVSIASSLAWYLHLQLCMLHAFKWAVMPPPVMAQTCKLGGKVGRWQLVSLGKKKTMFHYYYYESKDRWSGNDILNISAFIRA